MERRFSKACLGVLIVGAGGMTAASAATGTSTTASAPGGTGIGLAVVVQNKATQPIPVGGTVSVSNLPAVQNVSGTVNVGNLPATQNVSGSVNVGNLPATQNVAGTVNVGNLPAVQTVQPAADPAKQIVMQTEGNLTTGPPGLIYLKLFNELSGASSVSGRLAVTSITISQFGGSQPLQVALRAASCDNSNGLGALEDVVVPQNQTVHMTYPSPVVMPFVPSVPASWCLFAQTVPDNGQLSITVVGTVS